MNKSHKRDLLSDKKVTPVAEHFFGGYATGQYREPDDTVDITTFYIYM